MSKRFGVGRGSQKLQDVEAPPLGTLGMGACLTLEKNTFSTCAAVPNLVILGQTIRA